MISAGEFRNGVTFEQDGQVLQVVEFQHVKPGKGAAFVRTKTKNVITGAVVETSYNPTAKFPQAFIDRREMTYSYEDGDLYYFMDATRPTIRSPSTRPTWATTSSSARRGDLCKILSYKGKVFGVEIPTFVELEVTNTEPGVKGNTATNTLKPATARDRRGDPCAPVHQRGRQDPHRYPHGRVYGARVSN
jgi:elongation factor P